MASERETAQRERAESRETRRNQPEESSGNGASADEQPFDGLKQAAKVAAASVALGAVAAAARALAERRSSSDGDGADQDAELGSDQEDEVEPEQMADAEPEREPDPEPEPGPREEATREEPEERLRPEPPARRPPSPRREPVSGATAEEARSVADAAQEQLQLLVGKEPETISALERNDDGWLVTLEVLEVSRIPESTDVLASYEVDLDEDRNLRRYARVRRYHRSQSDQDGRA